MTTSNKQQQQLAQQQQQAAAEAAAAKAAAEARQGAGEAGKEDHAEEQPSVTDTSATPQPDPSVPEGSRGSVGAPKLINAAVENAAKVPPAMPVVAATVSVSRKVNFELLDSEVERILEGVPAINRMQINGIVNYAKICDPARVISSAAIAQASVGLWHNLRLIICNESEHFEQVFTAALKVFELAGKGAMGEVYLYRATDAMKLASEDLTAYCDVTTMMRVLAPVKSRQAVLATSLKLGRSLRNGLTQEGINRVVGYFDNHK